MLGAGCKAPEFNFREIPEDFKWKYLRQERNTLRSAGGVNFPEVAQRALSPQQKMFHQEIDHTDKENNDRDLVDAVHHFDVDIGGARRILFPEKISPDFPEGKKFPHMSSLLLFSIMFVRFHINAFQATIGGSIQLPSPRIISISSSTAFPERTFLFTTSLPRYRVTLPGPEPTYP